MIMERARCGDCGVLEGEYHQPGCDMEKCPFCGWQLISCDCCYEKLGLFKPDLYSAATSYLPPEIYENGLTDEQDEEWDRILREKGLIPFILYPIVCAKCGKLWPELFMVSNDEWQHYISPEARDEVICRPCYDWIKRTIEKAKRSE